MATYTTYLNGRVIANGSGTNSAGSPASTVLVGEYDATKRNLAAADVAEVVTVPAGTYVKNVFYKILANEGSGIALNVGDGDDPDGYVAAADMSAAVGTMAKGGGALATGKLYSTADTIDIEVPAGDAFDTLKVRVIVECVLVG